MTEKIEWKKPDVSRDHKSNVELREVARTADLKTALNTAYQKSSGAFIPSEKKSGNPTEETRPPKPSSNLATENHGGEIKQPASLAKGIETPRAGTISSAKLPETKGAVPKENSSVLRQNFNAGVSQNIPTTVNKPAASVYTNVVTPQPHAELAQLLNTKKPVENKAAELLQSQPLAIPSKTVIAAQPAPQGEQAADASRKQREFSEKGEKKPEGKKSDKSRSASSKGSALLAETDNSEEGGKLEAASSGIASDGGEELHWIADEKQIKEVFNGTSIQDTHLEMVMSRSDWFQKYVLKNSADPVQAAEVLEKALSLNEDPELKRLLDLGMAARLNGYGGMRG